MVSWISCLQGRWLMSSDGSTRTMFVSPAERVPLWFAEHGPKQDESPKQTLLASRGRTRKFGNFQTDLELLDLQVIQPLISHFIHSFLNRRNKLNKRLIFGVRDFNTLDPLGRVSTCFTSQPSHHSKAAFVKSGVTARFEVGWVLLIMIGLMCQWHILGRSRIMQLEAK